MEGGVKDYIEQFNWQRDMKSQPFPSMLQPFIPEIKSFCDTVHNDVLFKVYRCKLRGGEIRRLGGSLLYSVRARIGIAQ